MSERDDDSTGAPLPFREAIDTDPDRGVALFTSELRLSYANACARTYLTDGSARDAAGALPPAVHEALSSYRSRLERSAVASAPGELVHAVEAGRRCRVTMNSLLQRGTRWYVVRFSPAGAFAECNLRRLQTRFALTLREAEVALAVIRGRTNKEVAADLGISEKTVKNSLMSVFAKVDVRNRVELALKALDAPIAEDSVSSKGGVR